MSLADSYRRLAPVYDRLVALPLAAARRASLERIPTGGRLQILLSAVGTGLDAPYLPAGHRYVGTDLVEAMLKRARPRIRALDFDLVRADSTRLPFAAERFDLVVLHLIVAVVAQPARVLAEAVRVTRPGGTLLVLDKFLPPKRRAPLRRLLSPLVARFATRLDVVFEEVLAEVPGVTVESVRPAMAGGWFRRIVLRKAAPGTNGG